MPGRLLNPQSASRETGKTMRVYKLTCPGSSASQESSLGSETTSGFRNAFMGRRFHNVVDYMNLEQQPMSAKKATASNGLEAPEMERFTVISEENDLRSNESVLKATSASTRTSNTISDDDSSLMESTSRTSTSVDVDFVAQPARHSTACCSDLVFRRELRKRIHVEPTVEEDGLRRDSTYSFAVGNSFRRELEMEDRVESLALWEEDHRTQPTSARNVAPHSWHAGDTAVLSGRSTRNKGLDAMLRTKKSSFFHGFFSGLSFSSSRKSRKSLG